MQMLTILKNRIHADNKSSVIWRGFCIHVIISPMKIDKTLAICLFYRQKTSVL